MSKKHQNDEPIALDKALNKSEAFVIKHKNTIIAAIAILIAFIAGLTIYMNKMDEKEINAKDAKEEVRKLPEAEQIEAYKNITNKYEGTDAANLSKAEIGFLYAKEGNYQEAIKYLEDFESDDNIFKAAVLGTLGDCYAGINNNEKAIETLKEAAEMAKEPILTSKYLYTIATLYEATGKKAEANKAYQDIITRYKNESLQAMASDTYAVVNDFIIRAEMGVIRTK